MEKHRTSEMMDIAMERVKELVDANSVVGEPILTGDGTTIIPISKVNFGVASGGSDFPASKSERDLFGGGLGAGVSIVPLAFLVCNQKGVKLLQLSTVGNTVDRIVDTVPDVVDKVSGLFAKGKPAAGTEE